jgi:tetraacyldisaccharide 4'-kinase
LYSYKPSQKTISVGNLSAGGTGKTPQIEYLIELLSDEFKIATLSRGYKRKTSGFKIANLTDTAITIGDEPAQFHQKYLDILVVVDSQRKRALKKLKTLYPQLDMVLLDDAFQHRSVTPGINILLSDYSKMYYTDYMLPSGTLREFRSGKKRADIIIVSKTPAVFSPIERRHILANINPSENQHVFFSYTHFYKLTQLFSKEIYQEQDIKKILTKETEVLVFSGIANPSLLHDFVATNAKNFKFINFPDHHTFTDIDIKKITETFETLKPSKRILITTEKDAMRLQSMHLQEQFKKLPLFFVSIKTKMHAQDLEQFNKLILNYARTNQTNS